MKKKNSLFLAIMSICFVLTLSACNLLAKVLKEGADNIDSASSEKLSPADEVSTLVAQFSTQTAQVKIETIPQDLPSEAPEPTLTETSPIDPTEENATLVPESPEAQGKDIRHMGLSFTIPAGLDYEVSMEEVDEAEDPSTLFPGQIGAAHIIFHLNPQTPVEHILKAKIMVFPMQSFMKVYETWQTEIAALNLLCSNGDFSGYSPLEALPFPPIFGAMQMYHAQEKALIFQNGSGIRFLAEYGQAYSPMATESLFYAFVGVTEDQNYIVVGTIPMGQSPLPEKVVWPSDMDAFYAQYDQLATNAAQLLNGTLDREFSPNLELLDKMFESLRLSIQ